MAVYTLQLKTLIENGFDLGLQSYPIWNENARQGLNNGILSHYYFREIGLETPQLFKFFINRALNEIMPYYNELYKTTQWKYDPTQSINVNEIYNAIENETAYNFSVLNGSSSATNSATDKSQNRYSDTPGGLIEANALQNNQYLTNATLIDGNSNSSGNSKQNQTTTNDGKRDKTNGFTRKRTGNEYHNVAELIRDYRDNIIIIENEIINHPKIAECFMQIY